MTDGTGRTFKIVVAIPSRGQVDIRWCMYLHHLLNNCPPGSTIACEWHYGLAETRQMLAEQALRIEGMTHILFLDDDILPPAEAVAMLLADNKSIVSGLYFNSLHTGVAAWIGGQTIALEQKAELVQVDKVGLGICLINLDVFRDLLDDRPWFYYKTDDNKILSEDFFFFNNVLKRLGIKPYVDMRVKCSHIKTYLLNAIGEVAG